MRSWIPSLLLLLIGTTAAAAQTGQNLPVVEMFTSQGCSSCPPADKLMETLAQRKDLVALSFSVDIWDYLGWKDTLASPKFTYRQRTYATARGDGNVYTPQAVVNGMVHVIGSDKAAIEHALKQTRRPVADDGISLSAKADGAVLKISAGTAASPDLANGTLWLVTVRPKVDVNIKSGENSGRTLTYFNVVREMTPVGMWSGAPTTVDLPAGDVLRPDETCAVLLQKGKGGPILAGTWLQR